MDPRTLPKTARRLLAIGLAAVSLGLAAAIALVPIARTDAMRNEAAAIRDLVSRAERLRREAGANAVSPRRDLLVPGATDGIAGAELQRVVSELARASALNLRSTQIAPPKREADLTAVSVDASMQGNINGVRALLHALETGSPLLFVEGLSLRTVTERQAPHQPVSLDISLKVRGYAASTRAN
jgi:general secretion pathway protein M